MRAPTTGGVSLFLFTGLSVVLQRTEPRRLSWSPLRFHCHLQTAAKCSKGATRGRMGWAKRIQEKRKSYLQTARIPQHAVCGCCPCREESDTLQHLLINTILAIKKEGRGARNNYDITSYHLPPRNGVQEVAYKDVSDRVLVYLGSQASIVLSSFFDPHCMF